MIFCSNCKKEMKCTKTGRPIVFMESHVYFGDEFSCGCGAKIIKCGNSIYVQNAKGVLKNENPILMGG